MNLPPYRVSRGTQLFGWFCRDPSRQPEWFQCRLPRRSAASSIPPIGKDVTVLPCRQGNQAASQTSFSTEMYKIPTNCNNFNKQLMILGSRNHAFILSFVVIKIGLYHAHFIVISYILVTFTY